MHIASDSIADLVRRARESSGLNKVDFARAAGTTRAAVDQYEKGVRIPRVDSLLDVLEPGGYRLRVDPPPPASDAPNGLSLASFVDELQIDDSRWTWRTLISDFVANDFAPALTSERRHLLAPPPTTTGSQEWDAFLAALAQHLAFHAGIKPPLWIFEADRGPLDSFWWPVHGSLPTMRSAALAFSPAAFRQRRIAIDGRELPYIAP